MEAATLPQVKEPSALANIKYARKNHVDNLTRDRQRLEQAEAETTYLREQISTTEKIIAEYDDIITREENTNQQL